MNKKIIVSLGIVVLSYVLIAKQAKTSPFIAKKKTGISASKLKEESVQHLVTILQTFPSLLKAIAYNQELAMERMTEYLESEKKCFWSQASTNQLMTCKKRIALFQSKIEQMNVELNNFVSFLNSLALTDNQSAQQKVT